MNLSEKKMKSEKEFFVSRLRFFFYIFIRYKRDRQLRTIILNLPAVKNKCFYYV